MKPETVGLIFILIEIFAIATQPVFAKIAVGSINPIFAAAMASLVGGCIPLILLIRKKRVHLIFNKAYAKEILLTGFFGTTITYSLFFLGAQMTSVINAAILMQSEPIYSLFLGYFLLKEKITGKQILATFLIVLGVVFVIYNGTISLNLGDVLILLTPLFYQISHVIAKRIMKQAGAFAIQAGRHLSAGLTMLFLSSILGMNQFHLLTVPENLAVVLLFGIVVAGIGTLAWYEAIKRINLSKATALIAPYSVLSIVFAWLFMNESPSVYQIAGLVLVLAGIFTLAKIKSEIR